MNRMGLGLAVGAGYLLGRTRKLKTAVAVGTMVAGRKMNLTPKGIAELVSAQLQNNPQFKEIGDQLRTDLRGVGKAASGALVERQIDALADRLHGRTAQVRDQLSGTASKARGEDSDDSGDSGDSEDTGESRGPEDAEAPEHEDGEHEDGEQEERGRRRERPAKKAPAGKAPAKKAAAKTSAKAPAGKTAAKRAQPARKAAGKKTAQARNAARGAGSRQSKGGGE
ncbi:DNA primase [Streptomyces sp. NPDC006367]|uniref:DNA primase n=1 Tax=unclassified Streptomyces TaxID=2593676 RepID=UPI0033B7938B